MADFRSKKNMDALEEARKAAKEKFRNRKFKGVKKAHADSIKVQRTSKVKGDTFVLKGKPKHVSGGKPNFTRPVGGPVAVRKSSKAVARKAGKKAASALSVFKDPNVINTTGKVVKESGKKVGKTIAKKLAKGALGLGGLFFQEGVGESPEIEQELLARGREAALTAAKNDPAHADFAIQKSAEVTEDVVKAKQKAEAKTNAERIKSNKKAIKKAIDENEDLDKEQTKEAKKFIDNDADIDAASDRNSGLKEKGTSAADQFKEAMLFFAPQLIGGLIGGAIEGDAGAVAGFEKSGELRDSFIDFQQEQTELELKKVAAKNKKEKRDFQQLRGSSYRLPDGTLVPMFGDASTGALLHPVTHMPLKPEEMQNIISEESRRLAGQEHRFVDDTQFSGKQQEVQSGFDNTRASLDAIDTLFDVRDESTGVVTGRYNDLAAMAGQDNAKYVALRTETGAAIASFLKTTSGATVSEQERAFLRTIIPTTTDSPAEFQTKLGTFRTIVLRQQRKELKSIADLQPLKRKTALAKLDLLNQSAEARGIEAPKHVKNKVGPKNVSEKNVKITEADIDKMTLQELREYTGE